MRLPVYLIISKHAPVYLMESQYTPLYLMKSQHAPVYRMESQYTPLYLMKSQHAPVYLIKSQHAPVERGRIWHRVTPGSQVTPLARLTPEEWELVQSGCPFVFLPGKFLDVKLPVSLISSLIPTNLPRELRQLRIESYGFSSYVET